MKKIKSILLAGISLLAVEALAAGAPPPPPLPPNFYQTKTPPRFDADGRPIPAPRRNISSQPNPADSRPNLGNLFAGGMPQLRRAETNNRSDAGVTAGGEEGARPTNPIAAAAAARRQTMEKDGKTFQGDFKNPEKIAPQLQEWQIRAQSRQNFVSTGRRSPDAAKPPIAPKPGARAAEEQRLLESQIRRARQEQQRALAAAEEARKRAEDLEEKLRNLKK